MIIQRAELTIPWSHHIHARMNVCPPTEPVGRFDHYMAAGDSKCYLYGGRIEKQTETLNRLSKAIRVFDNLTGKWSTIWTKGDSPEPLFEGACCSSPSGDLYYFGGQTNDTVYSNKLYHLSTITKEWQLLEAKEDPPPGVHVPMKKIGCGMVWFRDPNRESESKLTIIGGCGILSGPEQQHSTFLRCTNHGWTNEIHIFDINESMLIYYLHHCPDH